MSSKSVPEPQLFQPIEIGDIKLQHRVVMAPLTRFRADSKHVPSDLAIEYYSQRASVPGTLIVSEGTFIAQKAGGYGYVPGIWNDEQVSAWKKITDAVHAKGSYIYCQLWALGRGADPKVLENENLPYVSASAVPHPERSGIVPRPLTVDEIQEYVQLYADAAKNAVRAGFDGVEVHGANGYLVDQFLQDMTNLRTDEYGGTIEKRARFGLEVMEAIAKAIGQKKTAIRLSPWEIIQGMGMEDPKPTFSYFIQTIKERLPDFAYIHVTEARVYGDGRKEREWHPGQSNDFVVDIWSPKPVIIAGGFTRELALEAAGKGNVLVAFGRYFTSTPDLPFRLQKNIPLTPYNRATFYSQGSKGYIDYPFSEEALKANL